MSGAPGPPPEAIIDQHLQHLRDKAYNESTFADDSDDDDAKESNHQSAARRFSRRKESEGASTRELTGILTVGERRASRRESQAAKEREAAASGIQPQEASLGHAGKLPGLFLPGHASTSRSSVTADISARRPSRTSQMVAEEKGMTLPPPAFANLQPTIPDVESPPQTPATDRLAQMSMEDPQDLDSRGSRAIMSWRGGAVLATAASAHLIDDIWMTSINIAVPKITEEFGLPEGSKSWLLSAYTLTFGGFLLLAGVLADRFGRRKVFCLGMVWMAVFSVACGFSKTGVQCIIFRAMQGLGAAASVPSAIGVLSNYFLGHERHRAISIFGAAGAVGFVVGLVMSGILSGTIGWRYIFFINSPLILLLAITGWLSFPEDQFVEGERKPSLDFLGAALGTSGMVLMTFALSQSEVTGWDKPIIIVTLIVSVFVLLGFAWAEKKVQNPIMPLYLWKLPSFAGIWCSCFLLYCWYGSVVYYITLICQDILYLSPLITGLCMIPMGVSGAVTAVLMGRAVEKFPMKTLLLIGFAISSLGTLPAAFVHPGDSFWPMMFPATVLCVVGVSFSYNVASIALVSAVPPAAKSLAGGLINTAFQIGSGFGLALTSVMYESVLKKQEHPDQPAAMAKGYQAATLLSCGMVGASFFLSLFTVKGGQQATGGTMVH